MMFNTFTLFVALASAASVAKKCTPAVRLQGAKEVVKAYNEVTPGKTAADFNTIPFGVPNHPGACTTVIIPNGSGCLIPVATTGNGVIQFGIETRQVFSDVTGEYVDFPSNGTTLINTNVTLGARNILPIPITFTGEVFLDYNSDCRIYAVRAYAQVPTKVLNHTFQLAGIPLPPCQELPV